MRGKQANRRHALMSISTDADRFRQRLIDESRGATFPPGRPHRHIAGRARMVISKEHLRYRVKARGPRVETEEAGEMKMQNLGAILPDDGRQFSCGFPSTVC